MNLNAKGIILKLLKSSTGECLYKPRTRKVSSNRTLKLRVKYTIKSKKTGQKLKEDIYMYIINKRPVTSLSVLQDNSMDKKTRPDIS